MAAGLWRIPLLPPLIPTLPLAVLALADGSIFPGYSIGAPGETAGEVVFNTAITGYQEILTDPSYSRQLVTLTYPHIGNVGVNQQDCEASKIHAAGLIIKDLAIVASNFRSEQTLSAYLQSENVVGIAGIDTRKLTRICAIKEPKQGRLSRVAKASHTQIYKRAHSKRRKLSQGWLAWIWLRW
jgi:carbamoyl-phosphate synthase small subunit